jgi:hypothetical protein
MLVFFCFLALPECMKSKMGRQNRRKRRSWKGGVPVDGGRIIMDQWLGGARVGRESLRRWVAREG